MITAFCAYIENNGLLSPDDKVLLGVSGGPDSMVMLHLFQRTAFRLAVVHCNFHLRGSESDSDERFVRDYCNKNGLILHVVGFDTMGYVAEHRVSVEVAARELRYAYFDELCRLHGYTKIAVAHNLNDSAETVILNLARGTGIRGLCGIRPANGKVVRPLLFATRAEIEAYAVKNGLYYRTDSTNADTVYRRNYVRHKVMPELKELNPSVDRAIAQTACYVQEAYELVQNQLSSIRQRVISCHHDGSISFSVDELRKQNCINLFMVEELALYAFSSQQAEQAAALLNAETGKRVESETHIIYRNRQSLILLPKGGIAVDGVEIKEGTGSIVSPINLRFDCFDAADVEFERSGEVAFIDSDKLSYPLTLRKWRPGDRFVPFGMHGFKKISDFLVDIKLPLHQKSNVYVLISANKIVWVVGQRLDNRFRISDVTRHVLRVRRGH